MTTITSAMVKELRDQTGAGMMDCKTALVETNGNMEEAVDWLRKKGLSKAAKKSGRIAADGLIAVAVAGHEGAMVEVNAETDFVARNETFQTVVKTIALVTLTTSGGVEHVASAKYPGESVNVTTHLQNMVAKIGENMGLRRSVKLVADHGVVAAYVHNAVATDLGRIGVLVALESKGDKGKLLELGRKLAMHISFAAPVAVTQKDVPAELVKRERAIFEDQAKQAGKPANVIEKMVEGRIAKFYGEVVLLKQPFIMDPDKTVEAVIAEAATALGHSITVKAFDRYALGDGIEKQSIDFAAEVAAAVKG